METSCKHFAPHPSLLELLFIFKSKVSSVYRDILGIHEIAHIAITQITTTNHLICLSSTPALEFNLFNSTLWQYDATYTPNWFSKNTHEYWDKLYDTTRYDELYYVKQIKPAYPLGMSLASHSDDCRLIYTLASKVSNPCTQSIFTDQIEDFYKIGQYCFNELKPLFEQVDTLVMDPEYK